MAVGTNKSKKNKQNRSRKTAATKQHRRAGRKAKDTASPDRMRTMVTMPIWDYPRFAATMAEFDPSLTYEDCLAGLLSEPVYLSEDSAPPRKIVPAESIRERGVTVWEYLGGIEEMIRLGTLSWDPVTYLHHIDSCLAAVEPQ